MTLLVPSREPNHAIDKDGGRIEEEIIKKNLVQWITRLLLLGRGQNGDQGEDTKNTWERSGYDPSLQIIQKSNNYNTNDPH